MKCAAQKIAFGWMLGLFLASGASADDFTLENVHIVGDRITYHFPRMEFSRAKLTRAEAEALLSATNSLPIAERFKQLSAEKIIIPVSEQEVTIPEKKGLYKYYNIVLQNVTAGLAIQTNFDKAEFTYATQAPHHSSEIIIHGEVGPTRVDMLNLAEIAALCAALRTNPDQARSQFAGRMTVANLLYTARSFKHAFIYHADRLVVENISGRPLATPFMKTMEEPKTNDDSEQSQINLITQYQDVLSSFSFDNFFTEKVKIETKLEGGAKLKNEVNPTDNEEFQDISPLYSGFIDTFFIKSFADGKIMGLEAGASALEMLLQGGDRDKKNNADAQKARLMFDRAVASLDFSAWLKPQDFKIYPALQAIYSLNGAHLSTSDGELTLSRLDMDLTSFTQQNAGHFRSHVEKLAVIAKDPDIRAVLPRIENTAATLSMDYDPKEQILTLAALSLKEPALGSLHLETVVSALSKDALSEDQTVATAAIALAHPQILKLSLEDAGMMQYLINFLSDPEDDKESEPDQRETFADGVSELLTPIAQPADKGKALLTALRAFILGKTKTLTIEAKPAGSSSFADIALALKLNNFLNAVTVTIASQ